MKDNNTEPLHRMLFGLIWDYQRRPNTWISLWNWKCSIQLNCVKNNFQNHIFAIMCHTYIHNNNNNKTSHTYTHNFVTFYLLFIVTPANSSKILSIQNELLGKCKKKQSHVHCEISNLSNIVCVYNLALIWKIVIVINDKLCKLVKFIFVTR